MIAKTSQGWSHFLEGFNLFFNNNNNKKSRNRSKNIESRNTEEVTEETSLGVSKPWLDSHGWPDLVVVRGSEW